MHMCKTADRLIDIEKKTGCLKTQIEGKLTMSVSIRCCCSTSEGRTRFCVSGFGCLRVTIFDDVCWSLKGHNAMVECQTLAKPEDETDVAFVFFVLFGQQELNFSLSL